MATVADADPAFVARQRALFDNLGSLRLASYSLRADWERYGDLARPSDRRRYPGAEDLALPVTEERYRIAGFDRADAAVEDLYYTFVRDDGGWKIAADDDLDRFGLFSARHLWDTGPLYVRRSEHFLLLGHPCAGAGACSEVPPSLLPLAERALDQVSRYWKSPWPRRTVVLVPAGEEELVRMLQATFDPENFVAFAYSTIDIEEGPSFTAPRIVFDPGSLLARPQDDVYSVLVHELLHVATRRASGPFVPIFIEEGFADYVGRDADPAALGFLKAEVAAGRFDGRLPRDREFTTGDATSIFRSYQESHSAIRYLVERWGLRRFLAFYENLGARRLEAGTARFHVDDAMRDVIGIGLRRFEAAWADSLQG